MVSATTVLWTGLVGSAASAAIALLGVYLGAHMNRGTEKQKDEQARATFRRTTQLADFGAAIELIRHSTGTLFELENDLLEGGDLSESYERSGRNGVLHRLWEMHARLLLTAHGDVSDAFGEFVSAQGRHMKEVARIADDGVKEGDLAILASAREVVTDADLKFVESARSALW